MSALQRLRGIAKLLGLRALTLGLMLLQNVLIARYLSLAEIGEYYLLTTVAYLGNALVYVGADLYLQRQVAALSASPLLGRRAVSMYVVFTALLGVLVVLPVAAIFYVNRGEATWPHAVAVCVLLSMASYGSSLGRNLLQLAAHPVYANFGPICEGLLRTGAIIGLVFVGEASALNVATASALGSLLAALVAAGLLSRVTDDRPGVRYLSLRGLRPLTATVMPVGSSGLLNWLQLQGYRPAIEQFTGQTQLVGTVSFLSMLGATAANAVFTVLGQMQIPKQYATRGQSTMRYLSLLLLTAVALAALSLPAGWVFLQLSARPELLPLVYLVALGVLLESGNAAIGVCTNHANSQGLTLWSLPVCTLAGCLLTYALMLGLFHPVHQAFEVATCLLLGQALTVTAILFQTLRTKNSHHAQS